MEFDMNHIEAEEAEYQGSSEEESSVQEVVIEENSVVDYSDGEFSVFSSDSEEHSEENSNDDSEDDSEDDSQDDSDIDSEDPALKALQIIMELEDNECSPDEDGDYMLMIDQTVLPHIFEAMDRFCSALQDNTIVSHIRLYIPVFVEPERFTELGKVLATLVALQTLYFEYHYPSGMLSLVAEIVWHARQISSLILAWEPSPISSLMLPWEPGLESGQNPGIECELHAQHLVDALHHHPALETIALWDLSPDEARLLTAVFPTMSRLQKIDLGGGEDTMLPVHPETLSHVLQVMSLRELGLHQCIVSDLGLKVIGEGLRTGSPLKELFFLNCQFSNVRGSALSRALKCNTELKVLYFYMCSPDSTFFSALKDSLSTNTTLTELSFTSHKLPEQAIVDLVAAARSNYGLEKIDVCVRDTNQKSLLRCIPCLNKAGRRYLIEDPTCKERGMQVMEEVKDDLDCLFLHLQENPLLCMHQKSPLLQAGRERQMNQGS
jgi:hypothetical protein